MDKYEELFNKYRKLIRNKRVELERTNDFQSALVYHLKRKLEDKEIYDIKINSFLHILKDKRRKLTEKEFCYLKDLFLKEFS